MRDTSRPRLRSSPVAAFVASQRRRPPFFFFRRPALPAPPAVVRGTRPPVVPARTARPRVSGVRREWHRQAAPHVAEPQVAVPAAEPEGDPPGIGAADPAPPPVLA